MTIKIGVIIILWAMALRGLYSIYQDQRKKQNKNDNTAKK